MSTREGLRLHRTRSLSGSISDELAASEELALHRSYLRAMGAVAGLLLEESSEQNWTDVMRVLAETTGADFCALYLNDSENPEIPCARLRSTWSAGGSASRLADYLPFRQIQYDKYPLLSDSMHVGMILARNVTELPAEEFSLFGRQELSTILCVPLLIGGELEGFIGFFSQGVPRQWRAVEIDVLCTMANSLALALVRSRMETSLRASSSRLRALVGATEDLVIEYDFREVVVNVWTDNPAFSFEIGDDAVGRKLSEALPNDMARAIMLATPRLLSGEASETFEFTLTIDDEDRFFLGRLQTLASERGQSKNVVALIRDVTEVMQEEARRLAMLQTLDLLEEAIIDLSPDGVLVDLSAGWGRLLEMPRSETDACLGRPLAECVHEEDRAGLEDMLRGLVAGEQQSDLIRFRMPRPGHDLIWVEARLLAHRGPHGQVTTLRGILRDITDAYLQERRITQLALHDALTQLPNRVLLEEHLQQAVARAQRNKTKVALGFVDLDHFKHINDTLGHKAGDLVLVTLSKRLQSVLREIDTLARWGGDEFVVLLPDANSEEDIRAIAERLRDAARQSVEVDGIETKLTISLGFAIFPDDADSVETLMSVADHTMFHAKSVGRNNVQFYRDIHDKTLDRENVRLQTRLSRAVQERSLQVFYQPVMDVQSGQVSAFEALARWQDDEGEWISPEVFIPMAEHLGIIQEIGEQVAEHAFERLRAWRDSGFPVNISLNISRAQLFAPAFVENLLAKLKQYRLSPGDVVLEITETIALLDLSYESRRLQELAHAGFSLAIDDFGTGYSALAQLHQMPVHMIKIDSSFTSRLDTEDGRRIVQAIVQMADALALKMIVEGVETPETAGYLESLGVTHMQGTYFGEAVPAGMCPILIRKNPTLFG